VGDDEGSAPNEVALNRRAKDPQPVRVVDFVEGIKATPSPAFHFLHVVLPHLPYQTLPDGTEYEELDFGVDVGVGLYGAWIHDWFTQVGLQRLVWQTQYTDRLLGGIIETLEQEGIYDSSAIVVVADHGAGFTTGEPFRFPERDNLHQLLWSPLFVKEAHQQDGAVDDTPLTSLDVLPTIADLLDVEVPWELTGASALDPDAPHPDERRYIVLPSPPFNSETSIHDLDGAAELARVLQSGLPPPTSDRPLTDVAYEGLAHRALVGRRVDDLEVEEPTPSASASLVPDGVGRGSPLAHPPAVVAGRLTIDLDDGDPVPVVALAIDGTIEAVSPALRVDGGGLAFVLLMPEVSAAAGGRPADLYLVSGEPDQPATVALSPVQRTG
jgi:hypothetical protein